MFKLLLRLKVLCKIMTVCQMYTPFNISTLEYKLHVLISFALSIISYCLHNLKSLGIYIIFIENRQVNQDTTLCFRIVYLFTRYTDTYLFHFVEIPYVIHIFVHITVYFMFSLCYLVKIAITYTIKCSAIIRTCNITIC